MNITEIVAVMGAVGAIIFAFTTIYYNRKTGKDKIGDEVLNLYQKQIEALKEDILRAREQNHEVKNNITVLTLEIGKLKGKLEEKDARIEELTAIISNRNPELEKVLAEIRDFMKAIHSQTTKNEKRNTVLDAAKYKDTKKITTERQVK